MAGRLVETCHKKDMRLVWQGRFLQALRNMFEVRRLSVVKRLQEVTNRERGLALQNFVSVRCGGYAISQLR